jgi:hypothetical protein
MTQSIPRYVTVMPGMRVGRHTPYPAYVHGRWEPGTDGLGIVWFIPLIVSAAIGAASQGAQMMIARNQASGAQKSSATSVVNDTERHMRQNLDAWNASPTKYLSEQAVAVETYDRLWDYLIGRQGCGNPALGQAGQFCISERSPGGKWDYKVYYRDPIANDAAVQPDPGTAVETDPATGRRTVVQNGAGGAVDRVLGGTVAGVPIALLAAGGLLLAAMTGRGKS